MRININLSHECVYKVGARSPNTDSSVDHVYNDASKRAYKAIKEKNSGDIEFLTESVHATAQFVKNPDDVDAIKDLSKTITKASKRTDYASYAASLALVFVGGMMMGAGVTVTLLSTVFAAVTLPTLVGTVVGALGAAGGVGLTAAGAALYSLGTGASAYTFWKPKARLERNIRSNQEAMLNTPRNPGN